MCIDQGSVQQWLYLKFLNWLLRDEKRKSQILQRSPVLSSCCPPIGVTSCTYIFTLFSPPEIPAFGSTSPGFHLQTHCYSGQMHISCPTLLPHADTLAKTQVQIGNNKLDHIRRVTSDPKLNFPPHYSSIKDWILENFTRRVQRMGANITEGN